MAKFDEYVKICKAVGDARYTALNAGVCASVLDLVADQQTALRGEEADAAFESIFGQVRNMIAGKQSARVLFDAGVSFAGGTNHVVDHHTDTPVYTQAVGKAIHDAATKAEHARILAVLETCRPTTQPYTRRDWALEERGKNELFAKIMKALGQPVKEGGE
jgi:hypothetical protein